MSPASSGRGVDRRGSVLLSGDVTYLLCWEDMPGLSPWPRPQRGPGRTGFRERERTTRLLAEAARSFPRRLVARRWSSARDGVVKEVAELESGESRAVDSMIAWGTAPRRQLQHIPPDVRGLRCGR